MNEKSTPRPDYPSYQITEVNFLTATNKQDSIDIIRDSKDSDESSYSFTANVNLAALLVNENQCRTRIGLMLPNLFRVICESLQISPAQLSELHLRSISNQHVSIPEKVPHLFLPDLPNHLLAGFNLFSNATEFVLEYRHIASAQAIPSCPIRLIPGEKYSADSNSETVRLIRDHACQLWSDIFSLDFLHAITPLADVIYNYCVVLSHLNFAIYSDHDFDPDDDRRIVIANYNTAKQEAARDKYFQENFFPLCYEDANLNTLNVLKQRLRAERNLLEEKIKLAQESIGFIDQYLPSPATDDDSSAE